MRRRTIGAFWALFVCLLLGAALSAAGLLPQADTLLKELSIRESEAQDSFFNMVWDSAGWIPGGQKVFKAAAPDKKVAIVRGLGALLKAYTRTAAFRTRYAESWDANTPEPPKPSMSAAQVNKESDDSIKEMEESIKKMPPDMQKQMAEVVKQMKAQRDAMRNDKEVQEMLDSTAKQAVVENARRHQEELKEYEINHPKNPDAMIAKRLKEFLEVSVDVRYDAKLVKRGDLMRFESQALEEKPMEWKFCFRAGKEATDAARAFAQEWLKELGGK